MEKTNFRKIIGTNEYKFIVLGDPHIDSDYSDKKLLKKHLQFAVDNNIDVYCIGDLMDLMGSRRDPRMTNVPQKIRKGDQQSYYNFVSNYVASFLEPYKDVIKFISYGNHETAPIKFGDIDVLDIVVNSLNYKGANIKLGTYEGWLQFRLLDGTSAYNFKTFYNHGFGGKGRNLGITPMINSLSNLGDCDLVLSGHLHTSVEGKINIECINHKGNIIQKHLNLVRVPSYKYHNDGMGWATEKGMKQDPIGSVLIEIKYSKNKQNVNFQTTFLNEFYG